MKQVPAVITIWVSLPIMAHSMILSSSGLSRKDLVNHSFDLEALDRFLCLYNTFNPHPLWHWGQVRGSTFPDQVRDRLLFFETISPNSGWVLNESFLI
jgi:hypothetical protein